MLLCMLSLDLDKRSYVSTPPAPVGYFYITWKLVIYVSSQYLDLICEFLQCPGCSISNLSTKCTLEYETRVTNIIAIIMVGPHKRFSSCISQGYHYTVCIYYPKLDLCKCILSRIFKNCPTYQDVLQKPEISGRIVETVYS